MRTAAVYWIVVTPSRGVKCSDGRASVADDCRWALVEIVETTLGMVEKLLASTPLGISLLAHYYTAVKIDSICDNSLPSACSSK